ncbi:ATP-binding protein [Rhodoferax sp.]|uniref:ATP-binding protein n=1 Tax=Rhodoferax sp. TaxID=50421 RepID=UPI0025D8344F|nr:ATP-binding protein [Rhodoferax sp.]MCM2295048.1 ATP-binding protein [Rhodoferax sp.]
MHILRRYDGFFRWWSQVKANDPGLRTGLVGKLMAVFGVAAVLVLVLATLAWLSFQQVISSHERIVNEAIPAMEAVQGLVNSNSRISAWVEQLPRVQSSPETQRIAAGIDVQLQDMGQILDRLKQQNFAHTQSTEVRLTVAAMAENFRRQIEQTQARVETEQAEHAALSRQHLALDALLGLSEFLVANASTTTTANIANLYRLVDGNSQREQLFRTLDRLIEVDVDAIERMSELQLLCANLKTLLDQLQNAQQVDQITQLQAGFVAGLATLKRRIDDLRDPSLQQNSLTHYKVLAGPETMGPFAIRRQRLAQVLEMQQLGSQGSALISQLNEQASALATSGGKAIDSARIQNKSAVDRVLVGFLLVAALFGIAFFASLWAVFRHHVLTRLKGMETAVRALSTGNYDVNLTTSDQDPLAPLGRALEQVRDNVRARENLERQLRLHQEALESQVAERTAELKETNTLLEREVAEHAVARQAAEDANKAKNVFLGSLSHELRTPLSGVSGAVRLLEETAPDARQLEYIHMIGYANRTLLEILEDMLSFSRIEAGKLDLQLEPFSLRKSVEAMLSLQSVPAQHKGIALRLEVGPEVPEVVFGDRPKINQLLLNIIGNAIKFTDLGSVTVSIRAQAAAQANRQRIRFAITDTGIGIPPSKCTEVFKPFVQVEDTAHRRHGGTGLGLAICQRLVLAMGGEIGLESEENRGTCVHFSLELETADALAADLGPQPPRTLAAPRPLTVLVVEDDDINRLVCVRYLELLGHHALVAAHGAAAMALLAQHQGLIDAILMDISLPGKSGLEVVKDIRVLAQGRWAKVPVIVMSAHLAAQTQDAQAAAGLAGFLSKPFSLDALAGALGVAVPSGAVVDEGWLDEVFLAKETETLGVTMLTELLELFSASLPDVFAPMETALQDCQWQQLGKLAHRLRGSAANLGLRQLMAGTRELELAAASETPDHGKLQEQLTRLKAHALHSCQRLRQHLQPGPT